MRELLSAKQLHTIMERERGRADRNQHEFSVIIFTPGKHAAKRGLAQILFQRVRFTDDAGWLDERRLGLVLPDTPASGAHKLANDLRVLFAEALPSLTYEIITYPSDWFDENGSQRSVDFQSAEHGKLEACATRFGENGANSSADFQSAEHGKLEACATRFGENGANSSVDFQSAEHGKLEACATRFGENGANSSADFQSAGDSKSKFHASNAPALKTKTDLQRFFVRPLPLWKRMMDVIGALAGIILLSPFLLLIALAVKLNSPGPALFLQKRIGQGNVPFLMYKFRSMSTDASEEPHRRHLTALVAGKNSNGAFKLVNDPRTTRVGKFLRKWSLDELPQLFNVLKGDMTLVGPRPEPCYASTNYLRWYHRRGLEMKPGITGLWQIEGRSRVPYEEMIRMDLRYCQSLSWRNDVKLLCRTFKAVLAHEGAY